MSKPTTPDDQKILDVLNRAVCKALDRKRRLGQYAVVWRNGQVAKVPPEALPCIGQPKERVRKRD